MAELIRISEYCKVSRLNKSKVYRAINSGIIKTKKIDGVKYIDLENLPHAFKIDPVALHELDTSVKAVGKTGSAKPSGQMSDDHLTFFQSFCEQLEQKTAIALASQEETIRMLKNELQRKDEEVLKSKISPISLSEGALKELEERENKILQLEKDFTERIESISNLENSFQKLQERIMELEGSGHEKTLASVETAVDLEKIQQLEAELIETKQKLDNALKELDEKTAQIQDLAVPETERELKSKLNEQKKLVKNLELSIKKKQEKIFDLENHIKEAPQQIYDFENITDSCHEELKRLETELDVKQSKLMKLEKELKEYKYNIPGLEKESIDVQLRFSYLMNEIDELKNTLTVQDKRLKEKDKIIASSKKNLVNLPDDTIDVERLIQEKQEKIEVLEKALFEKDQKVIELEKLLVGEKPDSEFFDNFSDDDTFDDMIPEYYGQSERPSAKDQINDLKKSLEDKDEIISKLETMLKDKESGIHTALPILELPFDESQIINKIEDEELKVIFSAKLSKILDLETMLTDRDNYINQLEEKQKNSEESSLEEHRSKNDLIEKLEGIIEAKDIYIKEIEGSSFEKSEIESSDDDLVQVLEYKLQEKDHYITELESKLEQEPDDAAENLHIKLENLEKELQEKADYIIALEKELNADKTSSDDDGAKQIIQEQLDTIENLESLLKNKDEIVKDLEEELYKQRQSIIEPEESPLETLYQGYEEFSISETPDLYVEESEEFFEISSTEDIDNEVEQLKSKIREQESLIVDLKDKLTQNDIEDAFGVDVEDVGDSDELNKIKQQVELLSEELKIKEEIINQMQSKVSADVDFTKLEPFASQVNPEEIEELKLANQQANEIIFNKDDEIQELKEQLEKEKQKVIQFASQKADEMHGSSDITQYSPAGQSLGASKDEKEILKVYKEQMDGALAKIRELEWQNDQMAKKLNEYAGDKPDDPDKSGGWMKKL